MQTPGTFALHVLPGAEMLTPVRVRVEAQRHIADTNGRVFVTPECTSLDELEGQLNALQDDLDALRASAKRAFQRGG